MTGRRTRDEIPEIPFAAIREALINAYSHRIWHRPGYVQVDIYFDAVDIISPGWFVDGQNPEEHLNGESTSSDTRNRLIAATLFRSGDIESSGMGMRKIRELCDAAGVRITYGEVPFGTKLTFHRRGLFAELRPDVAELQPNVAESIDWDSLKGNERAVIEIMSKSGVVRTSDVADALGVPVRTARYALRKLIGKGIVESHGAARARTYTLKNSFGR